MVKKQEDTDIERFARMSRAERAKIIRTLMEGGGSYTKLARLFGVNKGVIAGICRDYKIPSKHLPGFGHVQKSSSGVPLRLAVSEEHQCTAFVDGHRCGYQKVFGSEYCGLPQHQALAKRRK
ncbi:MAG TPA: hypothetical protein VMU25_00200 [Candidatus Paceibacterota bacterium]|nr:hypothetical protein [Candidatus Paceibacterota bacterium]